jgi:hypothetical protein
VRAGPQVFASHRDTPYNNQGLPLSRLAVKASLALGPLSCRFGAPRGIRTLNRQIRSLVLCVDLVGSRRIWPAQVGRVVDLDGSRPVPSDRLDDQPDDQARGDVLAPSRWGRAANRSSSAPKGTVKRRHSRSARRDRQIARRSGRLGAPRHAGSRACGAAAPHGRWSVLAVRCSTGHRAGRGGGRRPTRRPGRAGPGRCRGCGPRRGRIRSGCGHRARPVGWARPGVGPARME